MSLSTYISAGACTKINHPAEPGKGEGRSLGLVYSVLLMKQIRDGGGPGHGEGAVRELLSIICDKAVAAPWGLGWVREAQEVAEAGNVHSGGGLGLTQDPPDSFGFTPPPVPCRWLASSPCVAEVWTAVVTALGFGATLPG